MKNGYNWWVASFLLSLLLVAGLTAFEFGDVEMQILDTYIVFHWSQGVISLTAFFITLRNFMLLAIFLINKNMVIALILAFIVPIVLLGECLLSAVLIRMVVETIGTTEAAALKLLFPVSLIILSMILFVVIEIKAIKKLRNEIRE